MDIIAGLYNNYTYAIDTTAKTVTVSGIVGYDLGLYSTPRIYNSTLGVFFYVGATTTFAKVLNTADSYDFIWTFTSLPIGMANGDTLLIYLDVSTQFAVLSLTNFLAVNFNVFVPIPDTIKTQVTGGYSVSQLFTSSTNAIRLRRSSDSAQQDFGFVKNVLDTAAITAFAGADTLFVVKFYDQTGNGHDLINNTPSTQPIFTLANGTNGQPCLTINSGKRVGLTLAQALPYTVYGYFKQNTLVTNNVLVELGADLATALTQRPCQEGGTYLSMAAGVNFAPNQKKFGHTKFCSYRYTNLAGSLIANVDNGPVIGCNALLPTFSIGSNAVSSLFLGANDGSTPDFLAQALLLANTNVSDADHNTIVAYLNQQFTNSFGTPLITFGDSFTVGLNASNTSTLSYAELTANAMSLDLYNYGISGTGVGLNGVPATAGNFSDLYNTVSLGTNLNAYITFCYGANDGIQVGYQAYYQSLIQYFISLGYNKNRLCIVSQYAQAAPNLADAATRSTECSAISVALGIRFADTFTAFANNGGFANITSGHPNDTGHALMATTIENALA